MLGLPTSPRAWRLGLGAEHKGFRVSCLIASHCSCGSQHCPLHFTTPITSSVVPIHHVEKRGWGIGLWDAPLALLTASPGPLLPSCVLIFSVCLLRPERLGAAMSVC